VLSFHVSRGLKRIQLAIVLAGNSGQSSRVDLELNDNRYRSESDTGTRN
jgi:hypothetical protein